MTAMHSTGTFPLRLSTPARARRAMSLMEVLFSLGIISVGLLGVVALLPLAANQVRKGTKADQAAKVGMNALNMIEVYGMTFAENIDSNANYASGNNSIGFETIWTHPDVANYVPGLVIGRHHSICIDPRFVADNSTATFPTVAVPAPSPSTIHFPMSVLAPTDARMWRVTLRDGRSSTTAWPNGAPMSGLVAERLFVDQDDVNFTRPDNDTFPAIQNYDEGVVRLNASKDALSWFATLVPRLESLTDRPQQQPSGALALPVAAGNTASTLSVVVVQGRPSLLSVADPLTLEQERLATITSFYSGGVSGGEMQMFSPNTAVLEQVKVNQWIMLAAQATITEFNGAATNLATRTYFEWYRVAAKTEIEENAAGTGYVMDVTLDGPDWNRPEWLTLTNPTRAVIVEDVVGVFQRTIRRETNNEWN